MSSMTFIINDASTGGATPTVQVTITENADGTLNFKIEQLGGAGAYLGDLRGFFFDIADETLIGSLTVTASSNLTEYRQGNDSIVDLGDGANMNGLTNADGEKTSKTAGAEANGYDVGIEIGTAGIGTDDVRSFSFTLDSSLRDLTLADFANADFGIRITSVGQDIDGGGTIDTARTGSAKIAEDIGSLANGVALSANTVAENASGAVVGALSASGSDGGTPTYTLSDARFEVVGGVLKLKDGVSLDYESEQSVSINVTATIGGSSYTTTLTINVTDVNEKPDAGADQTVSAAENVNDTTVLATVTGTDPDTEADDAPAYNDAFNDLSYSITGGNGSGLFEINSATGEISLASGMSLDYETAKSHTLTVMVEDGGGLSDTVDVTINVTDVNEKPTLTVDATPVSVAENSVPASPIADVDGTDPDTSAPFNTLTYSIVSVDGNTSGAIYNLFSINSSNGEISLASALDYEADSSYSLEVRVTDGGGLYDQKTLTVNVTDVNEVVNHAPTDISLAISNEGGGNSLPGAGVLGTLSTTDPDAGDSFTYSLLTGSSSGFSVSSSGTLTATAGLNPNSTYTLNIQTQDSGGLIYTETFNIITGTNQGGGSTGNDNPLPTGGTLNPILVGDDVIYGSGGDDWIYGGSGNDTIFGQSGNDRIYGGPGNDILNGGQHSDTYVFLKTDGGGVDIINGFSTSAPSANGDILDISDLLSGYTVNSSNIGQFVNLTVSGGNTTVQVDRDGSGVTYDFEDVVVLQGVTGLSASTLLTNGNLDVTP